MGERYWTQKTRDIWFFIALALSVIGVAWLFWPYVYVLLFAAVTVVVSWPLHVRVQRLLGQRKALAAFVSTVLLALLVFGPLGYLLYLFGLEIKAFTDVALVELQNGVLEDWSAQALLWSQEWMASTGETSGLPGWVADALSSDGWLIANLQEAVGEFLKTFGNAVTNSIPGILSVAVNLSIDLVIFVFAVVTLFMEGPAILGVLKNLSPMNDEYEERLFQVFGEFSINMVIGSLATAAIQGVVAAIGFGIAGLDRIVFLGVATAVLSFIPLVGTMALWVPVCMYLGFTAGWEWATFVAVWSIVFTGTVDNLLRPFFMRGNTDIHPLLVFLSVFGGMYWMGIPGVLVGPVLVAFFLALYTIYLHDYLGVEVQKAEDTEGMIARVSGWFTALLDRFSSEKEPRGEGGSQNSGANNSAQEVEEATQSDEEEATQLDEEATDESL